MTTYDLVMLLVLAVWWFLFRNKWNKIAVIAYYMFGVMVTDVICGLLILVVYHRYPNVLRLPALLMPIGGLSGLAFGAAKERLGRPPFQKSDQSNRA